MQARILEERAGDGPRWWVPAALAGWSLAGSLAGVDFRVFQVVGGIAGALLYIGVILLGGVLLGLATGPALRWILSPAPAAEPAP